MLRTLRTSLNYCAVLSNRSAASVTFDNRTVVSDALVHRNGQQATGGPCQSLLFHCHSLGKFKSVTHGRSFKGLRKYAVAD